MIFGALITLSYLYILLCIYSYIVYICIHSMIHCIHMKYLYLPISYLEGCEVVTTVISFIDTVDFPDMTV